jgi:hypothetical protein
LPLLALRLGDKEVVSLWPPFDKVVLTQVRVFAPALVAQPLNEVNELEGSLVIGDRDTDVNDG